MKTITVNSRKGGAGKTTVSVSLAMAARQAGLNLDVRRMPADGYWAQHWMKHPVGFGTINPRPSADVMMSLFFKSDSNQNESGWKNEKFDQLLLAARAETDESKRAQMYTDMQVMIHHEGNIGIPFFMSNLDGHNKKLKGMTPIPLGGMMGYTFSEHAWLES